MISAFLVRLGAWFGAAAGFAIALPAAVEAVTGETALTSVILGLSSALAIPLLVALYLRQSEAAGPFGAVAFTVNTVGLGLFGGAAFALNLVLFFLGDVVGDDPLPGPTMAALLGSAAVFTVGSVLFGASMVRARIHPRVPSAAYIVAFPVLAFGSRLPDGIATSALHVLSGATLIWLALSLTSGNPTDQRPGRAAVTQHSTV